MTISEHDYKQNAYYLIYLIRCVLNNKIPTKTKLDKIDLSGVFAVAKAHSLTAIAAYALELAGIYEKRFEEAKYKSIKKSITFDAEREAIFNDFNEYEIWHTPLKGTVLKEIYPKIGMREMCDNDILFDKTRTDDVRTIMKQHGFTEQKTHTGHDIVFHKKPYYNFEMHFSLFSNYKGSRNYQYFIDIPKQLITSNGYLKEMTHEDFYLYMTAHEHNHFVSSGTGLRSLVDAYIFLKEYENTLDWKYISDELDALELSDYEARRRKLVKVLFEGKKMCNDEKRLLDYYIFSSTYGTLENRVRNSVNQGNGKAEYAWKRLFLPLDTVKNVYPFFYNHKILLPILPMYRLFYSLCKSRKKILTEIKTLIKV